MGPRFLAVLALGCALTLRAAPGAADPPVPGAPEATVTTYAGSGAAGIADGAAATASFLEPAGLAVGAQGTVYVADAAAQRVRAISAAGAVTTLAGSGAVGGTGLYVRGGFRDGPAAQAQFDGPSGLAVAPDGALLVADRNNHCIRRISGGNVTTFAGNAAAAGGTDGTRSEARFQRPMGLAFDRAGDLFVADFGNGLREIDAAGRVTTLELPKGRGLGATAVATQLEGTHEALYVVLQPGIVRIDLADRSSTFYMAGAPPPGPGPSNPGNTVFIEARRDLGAPYALAPFGDHRFVYTDLANHAVRIVWDHRARELAGGSGDDASFTAGAYRNGIGLDARFDAPLGIARLSGARFVVADAGNRRIRLLTLRVPPEETLDDLAAAKRAYRIVYIGNSFVDYDGDTASSIASLVARGLAARGPAAGLGRPPRVFTVKLLADVPAIGSFVRNYFPGVADLVIWQLNSAELTGEAGGAADATGVLIAGAAASWQPILERELRGTRDALAADHTRFVVALNPMPWEISPVESGYQRLYDLDLPNFDVTQRDGTAIREALARSGVDGIDLYPAFLADQRDAARTADFGTLDHHFSERGRRIVADGIVNALLRLRPWRASAH